MKTIIWWFFAIPLMALAFVIGCIGSVMVVIAELVRLACFGKRQTSSLGASRQ